METECSDEIATDGTGYELNVIDVTVKYDIRNSKQNRYSHLSPGKYIRGGGFEKKNMTFTLIDLHHDVKMRRIGNCERD